jgi:enoyl-CoA hydratase/carnithine racemase
MTYEQIVYEERDAVAWITLNRPDAMNALTVKLCTELGDALDRAERDDRIRVVAITGAGRAFCAGADLKDMLASGAAGAQDTADYSRFVDRVGGAVERVRAVAKPVIAAVNGITMAGGLEMLLACDVAVAAREAKIGDGHANYGVFPGGGSAVVLPRRVGSGFAKMMLFGGEAFTADECLAMGLVQKVVPGESLQAEVQRLAGKFAEKSPLLLRRMKQAVADGMEQPEAAALRLERHLFAVNSHSKDFEIGLTAFRERKKPQYEGR